MASLATSTASARSSLSCPQPAAATFVALNVEHPLKNYLAGIGQSWWRKAVIPMPKGAFCGTASDKTQATVLKRFYVLLMAFPAHPTRTQWRSRFKPLIDSAIAFDRLIVSTYGPYAFASAPGEDLAWLRSIRNVPYGTNLD